MARMPTTLVLSAWEPELAPLRRLLGRRVRALDVALAAAGVGAVDAAVGAARAIAETRARRVIFVGTAGCYGREVAIDDAAVVSDLSLVSTAALRGHGYTPAPMVTSAFASDSLAGDLLAATGLPPVGAASPLAITRSAALARRIAAATGAALENLEAFAVARAAAAADAEFAAVLGVSNRVGPRAHAEWRAHHRTASEAACLAVFHFLAGPAAAVTRRARRPRARSR
jgi:purine-nucleoside phosphorylase